jgi:hypothetical protein
MRVIVEDVLWEGGVLTTDEIYRGVKAKHAQLGRLLPPRWQEEVRQILEAHCISHEGKSWVLETEPLVRQLLEAYRISQEGNSRFPRTDWASADSYRYLDLALPQYVAGDKVRNVVLGTFFAGLRQLRLLPNWVCPHGYGPVWRLWRARLVAWVKPAITLLHHRRRGGLLR